MKENKICFTWLGHCKSRRILNCMIDPNLYDINEKPPKKCCSYRCFKKPPPHNSMAFLNQVRIYIFCIESQSHVNSQANICWYYRGPRTRKHAKVVSNNLPCTQKVPTRYPKVCYLVPRNCLTIEATSRYHHLPFYHLHIAFLGPNIVHVLLPLLVYCLPQSAAVH